MTATARWVPTEGADEQYPDQEIDLGGGWHAIVGPDQDCWTWELWDTWLHDDETHIVASGQSPDEDAAKAAALTAYAIGAPA